MKGPCGYGRYNDDPQHIGCPRAKSDMTPCIARDGRLALAQDPDVCVGCGARPWVLLTELGRELGMTGRGGFGRIGGGNAQPKHADRLRDLVREATEPNRQETTSSSATPAAPPPRSPLYEIAKALVADWRDRVSLGYEGTWPQMDALAEALAEIDQSLATLDALREAPEEYPEGSGPYGV